jgi:muramoyltetrapeptide carboxypeptidase
VRILHGLDYEGLQRRLTDQPVAFVGHSDFTAIQLALLARAGLKSFGGPMLMADFGAENLSEAMTQHFWEALTRPTFTLTSTVPQAHAVDVSGTLWGGNLAVLASLVGTPYMPPVEGGILFVEDVNEQPFRLERTLYQLHLAGILERQQALVLGDFSGGKPFEYDNGYDLNAMIEHVRSVVGIPVITGLQFGHIPNLVTLPVGADAHLVSDAHGFKLTASGYPHLG